MRNIQGVTTTAGLPGSGLSRIGMEEFRREVCEVYDLLIGKGMDMNLAIKRTRAILKAANYPFVTYDTVITRLRAAGRFKKSSLKKSRPFGRSDPFPAEEAAADIDGGDD
jgi:hypothetical protein